ncbi:hypothetical protein HYH03_017664 [Edaphochlamys debaryana]|uniref:Uncharacterized protein n=1 Tax=Edaphochlamys debaryana TaxID=47281 RepID=A0A835XF96_9CHLO|nr:hypothetical protein HYH03_017664 [Edaphochlamys debaryana]|eukprot:KAG2483482.1 hypothetical protein HYH03_017664 [Edaphochlamys debaryana]
MWTLQSSQKALGHRVPCSPSHTWARNSRPAGRLGLRSAQPIPASTAAVGYEETWREFVSKVEGEWEGVTVAFDAAGSPQQLPDLYVPGAYKEWGVELWDWQSQSSTIADPGPGPDARRVRNLYRKLMPRVGCEADAIAFLEDSKDIWKDNESLVQPVTPTGGFLSAPPRLGDGRTKLEACLAPQGTEGRQRIRVIVQLMQHWEHKGWEMTSVEVTRETYDGAFNGGIELCGCAGGAMPFAKDPATTPDQLGGAWRPVAAHVYARNGAGQLELQHQGAASVPRPTAAPVLLPAGVWAACSAAGSDVAVEVGWVRGQEREVARAAYVGGRLERAELATEAR